MKWVMNSCENLICKIKNIALIRHNYIIKYLPLFSGIRFIFILHNKTVGAQSSRLGPVLTLSVPPGLAGCTSVTPVLMLCLIVFL